MCKLCMYNTERPTGCSTLASKCSTSHYWAPLWSCGSNEKSAFPESRCPVELLARTCTPIHGEDMHKCIIQRCRLAHASLGVMGCVLLNSFEQFVTVFPSGINFSEQLWVQTVEVMSKLHTCQESVVLMKRFRINRRDRKPT